MVEADYMDLLNFEKSDEYDERQKAALAYTEAITWDVETDDALWARLHANFSEPELVELGFFIALTMGQQRWLRTLNIQHHAVLAGTAASMAPGFEDAGAARKSAHDENYWAAGKSK
jgi:anti-sigma factor RsiW